LSHETQQSINAWQREHFPHATRYGVRKHFLEEVDEMLDEAIHLNADACGGDKLAAEMADVYILLCCLAMHYRIDLHVAVDEKMRVNRAREWNIQSDGTGRHV
jgi:NTP pyrophosphatase (non-canonical NTP hydrolase)